VKAAVLFEHSHILWGELGGVELGGDGGVGFMKGGNEAPAALAEKHAADEVTREQIIAAAGIGAEHQVANPKIGGADERNLPANLLGNFEAIVGNKVHVPLMSEPTKAARLKPGQEPFHSGRSGAEGEQQV